jgi:lipoate-protein ligase B
MSEPAQAVQPAYVYDLLAEPRPFAEVDLLQLELAAARSQWAVPDTIILCEHPPTLTLGRASDAESELIGGEEAYRALGWDVVRADRGGRSTWHGPGQLVCYPILDLRGHGKDLRRYAHDLEQVVIAALGTFGIDAVAGEDREHVGVWVGGAKIASLGIRVDSWVARHGFALNVDCDLGAFERFRACGLDATPFTSIAQELGRDVTIADARGPVLDALARVFSLELSAVPV